MTSMVEQREPRNRQKPACRRGSRNLVTHLLLVLILLLSTVPVLAQTTDASAAIIAQENAFWKSYVDGNIAPDLSKLFLPDFISVEEQIWNQDQVLTFVRQFHERCTLAPIKLLTTPTSPSSPLMSLPSCITRRRRRPAAPARCWGKQTYPRFGSTTMFVGGCILSHRVRDPAKVDIQIPANGVNHDFLYDLSGRTVDQLTNGTLTPNRGLCRQHACSHIREQHHRVRQ